MSILAHDNDVALLPRVNDTLTRDEAWATALDTWLSRMTVNTVRAYGYAVESFIGYCTCQWWDIEPLDVSRWVEYLRSEGCSAATIRLRVAALGSFFSYAMRMQLITVSPITPAVHKLSSVKAPAFWLDKDECRALLGAIDRSTRQGLRDYALILGYLMLGKRNSEWRIACVEDFEWQGKQLFFRWHGKGKAGVIEVPPPVWQSVQAWVNSIGKTSGAIFVAMNARAKHLPNVSQEWAAGATPLTGNAVGQLVRKYARKAGLKADLIHVHTLRHSAAMLRREAGDDVEQVKAFLGHSSLQTTQTYLHGLEKRSDDGWERVGAMLGISDDNVDYHNRIRRRIHPVFQGFGGVNG
jgi:site-specific recombinase XerD